MKNLIEKLRTLMEHPYVKLLIALALIFIGIREIYKDIGEISAHHGLTLYGLFVFVNAIYSIIQGVVGAKDEKDGLKN